MDVSINGSLGARGRFVCVLEVIGGVFCARVGVAPSEERGCDCDRECMGDSAVNALYCTELFVEGERLSDAVSSNPRTYHGASVDSLPVSSVRRHTPLSTSIASSIKSLPLLSGHCRSVINEAKRRG